MSAFITVQNESQLKFDFRSINPEPRSIYPRLRLEFGITHNINAGASGRKLLLSDIGMELKIKTKDTDFYIGWLISTPPLIILSSNTSTTSHFYLTLDHYGLNQIEKFRESNELILKADIFFMSEIHQRPETRDLHSCHIDWIRIAKSDWVEKILPLLQFKDVTLIEIPKLLDSEFKEITAHMNGAWKQYSMGEYDKVLIECRKALEELTKKVKNKEFKKEITDNGGKKTVPDWNKLLGNPDIGEIIGTITQKIFGFVTPGAHAGKAINREDADFALMITHSIMNLTIRKLMAGQ